MPQKRPLREGVDWSALFRTQPSALTLDIALIAVRIALTWVFFYYGTQKLFGAFNGGGIHATSLYFSNTAHLHPGGFFAVLGGLIEFGGAIAIGLGLFSRLAALALLGDQVMAMITVTWATGFGSLHGVGYQFNICLAVLAIVIIALGAGRLSVDNVIAGRLQARRGAAASGSSSSSASPEDGHRDGPGQYAASAVGTDESD